MKCEQHVIIVKVPLDQIMEEAKKQVPENFECVDMEYSDHDEAVFFSFKVIEDYEVLNISDSTDTAED